MTKYKTLAVFGLSTLSIFVSAKPEAADFGRLFFSPAERLEFEQARHAPVPGPIKENPAPEPDTLSIKIEDETPELKPIITIDGYVRRSHGTATLWVNGENNYDGDLHASQVDARATHLRSSTVHLTPIGGDKPISLKPGQSYDPNAVVTSDAYETSVIGDDLGGR